MKRRDFLKWGAMSGAMMASGAHSAETREASKAGNAAKLPRRQFGSTDEMLSIIGFGGIVVMRAEQAHANRVVAESFERGVNYFDVAPSYGDAEQRLGPALEPYRKDCFLACKTQKRDRAGAEEELKQSLEHMRTDYFDLYQLHAISDVEKDVDAAFQKGGVMELLDERKKAGQLRYLGFSAHSIDAALAAMDRYDFDSIMFPINFAAFYKGEFGPSVIKVAEEKGVARIAIKAMAKQVWPRDHPDREQYTKAWYEPLDEMEEASMGLRWTLSKGVTAAIPPGEEKLYRMALDIASGPIALQAEEEEKLAQMANDMTPLFPRT